MRRATHEHQDGTPVGGAQAVTTSTVARSFLGFDFGTRCIGVASGNTLTGCATALAEITQQGDAALDAIAKLVNEWQPSALVVGVPRHPDGQAHEMTQRAERFARRLESRFKLPVIQVDERYSSVEAARDLAQAPGRSMRGPNPGARASSRHPGLDAQSAVVILDQHLRSLESVQA
jgi:putative holliday junction resolvase